MTQTNYFDGQTNVVLYVGIWNHLKSDLGAGSAERARYGIRSSDVGRAPMPLMAVMVDSLDGSFLADLQKQYRICAIVADPTVQLPKSNVPQISISASQSTVSTQGLADRIKAVL